MRDYLLCCGKLWLTHGITGNLDDLYKHQKAASRATVRFSVFSSLTPLQLPHTRNFLLQQYGFNCTCAICSLPDARSRASDKRLAHMTELSEKLARWRYANIDGDEAIEVVRKIWDVREREGYWSERGQLAADATWVAAGHSESVTFKSHLSPI